MLRSIKCERKEVQFELSSEADESVFEEVFMDRDYRMIESELRNADVILDFGAHIGCFSVFASVLAGSGAKIFAFEPSESNFAALKKNLSLNGVKNVIAKNLAVAAEDGVREFFIHEDSHNHSFISKSEQSAKVNCSSVERIFQKFQIEKCDVMKVDIEGAEFEIFEKISPDLLGKVQCFCIEYHEFTPEMRVEKIANKLRDSGFKIQKYPSRYDRRMGMLVGKRS